MPGGRRCAERHEVVIVNRPIAGRCPGEQLGGGETVARRRGDGRGRDAGDLRAAADSAHVRRARHRMVSAAPKGAGERAAGERIGERRRIRDGQGEAEHAVDDATRRPPVRGHLDPQRLPGPVAVDHPGVAAGQELLDDQRGADGIGVLRLPRARPRAGKARGLGPDIRARRDQLDVGRQRRLVATVPGLRGPQAHRHDEQKTRTTSGRRASTARRAASMSPIGFSLCGRVPGARRTVTFWRGRWLRSIGYRCSSWGAVRWGWRWPGPGPFRDSLARRGAVADDHGSSQVPRVLGAHVGDLPPVGRRGRHPGPRARGRDRCVRDDGAAHGREYGRTRPEPRGDQSPRGRAW